ncbi:MAG: hypothetical protein QM778_34110 [Myxococcales bacterium]
MLIGGAVYGFMWWQRQPKPLPKVDLASVQEGLPRQVATLLSKDGALRGLRPIPSAPVFVVLRKNGRKLAQGWFEGSDAQQAIFDGVAQLLRDRPSLAGEVDVVELCLPHSYKGERLKAKRDVLGNTHRGVRGVWLRHGTREERTCPTEMIARNARFEDVEGAFRKQAGLSRDEYVAQAEAQSFDAHQLLVRVQKDPAVVPMFRGNTVIPLATVNQKSTDALAAGLTQWITTQVQPDGRMVYMALPSKGTESTDNNMIRQFMATVCLVRLANAKPEDAHLRELAKRNLTYNLDHFFVQEGELGLIKFGDARLGAMALAALAIVEAPFRSEFARYETALRKTTEHMQKPDGSFYSFFGSESGDNQNFYPGETLLLWATLYQESRDEALWKRIDDAFRYYRTWHLENRNPAFIPWHTQAYVKLLKVRDYPEMRDFVFKMNDWLLGMQQWGTADYPDQPGRFYDPDRPQFGQPHASSTAVYLEGLIDAYQLTVKEKDEARRKSYRDAILGGLRATMQIQFMDGVDMFYIEQRDTVYGGLRTTEYDNRIRVDNVQHALMGIQRIVRIFGAEGAW